MQSIPSRIGSHGEGSRLRKGSWGCSRRGGELRNHQLAFAVVAEVGLSKQHAGCGLTVENLAKDGPPTFHSLADQSVKVFFRGPRTLTGELAFPGVQVSESRLSVSAGATGLLRVVYQAIREAEVPDDPRMRNMDPNADGGSADQDLRTRSCRKLMPNPFELVVRKALVEPRAIQLGRQPVNGISRWAENEGALVGFATRHHISDFSQKHRFGRLFVVVHSHIV